ncbi:MAG: MATE family efflux transporter [Ruminococcaceae bacterium]|nr:MATE family efflux transporter [Oscillospiraceae bacterium]
MLNKFFGTKQFYKHLILLMVPIMIQNGITNFVNMLDNIMVGQVGTVQMTGVAVSNQLIFVFNLCIFGAISGAGIFGAQFYGKGDHKGLRDTFRFKLIFCVALTLLCIGIFLAFGENLIGFYLKGEGNPEDAALSLMYAKKYLFVMLIGMVPYTIAQCYSSTLRETGQTVVPMVAGVAAVVVNLSLNYVLIFGKLGAPKLGVIGAAVATVISRFAELIVVAAWTHLHKIENKFIIGAFKSLKIPSRLCGQIIIKGLPLMINETLWAAGVATINQCYSVKGLNVVAATNISTTFYNVFSVAFLAVGMSIGIILGQQLGAGKSANEVKATARHSITFSVLLSACIGIIYAIISTFIPHAYNTSSEVKFLATGFMQIAALTMPIEAYVNAAYFTLRSGGKAFVTFLFDSCFMWCINVVTAFILCNYTALPILTIYLICQLLNLIKAIIGFVFIKKGVWIKKIVSD